MARPTRRRLRRDRAEQRVTIRIEPTMTALDIARETARATAPNLTDAELINGLRELADMLERDGERGRVS